MIARGALALFLAVPVTAAAQVREVIAEIQIHGNNATSDEDVLAIAAVKRGDAFDETVSKPLLGGWSSLRGYRAGSFAGDTRVNGSLELRVPFSSPLSVAKLSVSAFVDAGKAYDSGVGFSEAPPHRGVGAGVWLSAAVVQFDVSVARGRHGDMRGNVGFGVGF